MGVSVNRVFIERVRLTGPHADVCAMIGRYQLRGFRVVRQNPLKLPGLRIDPNRIGADLERPHTYMRFGERLRNYA